MAHAMRLPSGRAAPTSGHGYADRTHAGIRSPSAKATASIAAITAKDAPSKLHSLTSHGRTHSGGGALEAAAETPTHAHASAKSNAKSNAHANANDSASGGGSQSHSGQSSGQSSASGSAKGSLRDRRGSVGALQVGSRVVVAEGAFKGKVGVIAYAGPVKFAAGSGGTWVGVCLDTADGKHDGSVQGERYFQCEPLHGIFVKKSTFYSMYRCQYHSIYVSHAWYSTHLRIICTASRYHAYGRWDHGSSLYLAHVHPENSVLSIFNSCNCHFACDDRYDIEPLPCCVDPLALMSVAYICVYPCLCRCMWVCFRAPQACCDKRIPLR